MSTEQTPIDYNALDNTFAGQLIQAGFIAALCAAPAFAKRPGRARCGIAAANLAAVAVFNAFDEDPRNDLTAAVEAEQGEQDNVAMSWGVLAAVAACGAGLVAGASAAVDAVAKGLGKAGVDKPYALTGAAVGAAYVVAKQLRP